jgi:hypothetical protein
VLLHHHRHCEELLRRSNPTSLLSTKAGLLRFARNDEIVEATMTKAAFDKIKAGLEDMRSYLDGSADKREFVVHTPADATAVPTSGQTQAQPPKDAK